MVTGCGCVDPLVFGHGWRCELDLGPHVAGGTRPDEPVGPPAMTWAAVPPSSPEPVRRWHDRVIAWAERFDRRYSELAQAHLELHGTPPL